MAEMIRTLKFFAAVCILAVAGCGGDADTQPFDVPQSVAIQAAGGQGMQRNALVAVGAKTVSVIALEKVSETRIDRTRYQYVFRVTLQSTLEDAVTGVTAKLLSVGAGTTIVDGSSSLATLSANSTASSTDTITLIHDRTLPFITTGLLWDIAYAQQQIARGTLVPGVRVLSADENSKLSAQTPTQLTYEGLLNFSNGAIVIGSDIVFKVVSSSVVSGRTIVVISDPAIDEVFEVLQFKGSFAATPRMVEAVGRTKSTLAAPRQKNATAALTYSLPGNIQEPGYEANILLEGSVTATADYFFDRNNGGLQKSSVEVSSKNVLTVNAIAKGPNVSHELLLGYVRIPIPVSIADSALALIGIRPVSIQIPFRLGVSAALDFSLARTQTTTLDASLRLAYDEATGVTVAAPSSGSSTIGEPTVVTPGGVPAYATFSGTGSVYLRVTPGVAFLDRVALLAIDNKASITGVETVQITPDKFPFFCLNSKASVDLTAYGYFKGVGFETKETEPIGLNVYTKTFEPYGNCKSPVLVTVETLTPTRGVHGRDMAVTVKVAQDTGKSSIFPSTAPSGYVDVSIGASVCRAVLTNSSVTFSTGSCSLVTMTAGSGIPISLTYGGDSAYAANIGTGTVAVDKAQTTTVLTGHTPDPSFLNRSVVFTAIVDTVPYVAGSDLSGIVRFTDGTGRLLCEGIANSSGEVSCTGQFNAVGTATVLAVYRGNANYLTSTSASKTHNVVPEPYQIEVTDNMYGYPVPVSCVTVSPSAAWIQGLVAGWEQCTTGRAAGIRCIGASCNGRVAVSVVKSNLRFYGSPVFGTCSGALDTLQTEYGIPGQSVANSTYNASSPYWFNLGSGGFIKPWPSVSPITVADSRIFRNWNVIQMPPAPSDFCMVSRVTLDVEFNVYDKQLNTYTRYPIQISLP